MRHGGLTSHGTGMRKQTAFSTLRYAPHKKKHAVNYMTIHIHRYIEIELNGLFEKYTNMPEMTNLA